ncbi:MAG: patatin-like phospholipase family protein [Hyphomonadaceae bacterium]
MTVRALVLGGGGPLGIAWETGVLAGLAEGGVSFADLDLVLGTSAGSVVGSQIAAGKSPQAMADAELGYARHSAAAAPASPPDLTPLLAFMMRFPPTGEPDLGLRRELGAYSLGSQTIAEDAFIDVLTSMGLPESWPDGFACTAVDTASGEFHVWRKQDGVALPRAVASSCSVPGIYPAISINDRKWMDGGMRASVNLDKAAGCKRVLALAVIPVAMAEPIMRGRVEHEGEAVTEAGGRYELVSPDAAAMEAFGPNLMDGSRREPALKAGLEQGRREAERVKAFWA